MATWGEFINEIPVVRIGARTIYVTVDDAITLFTERNALRDEVARLRAALAADGKVVPGTSRSSPRPAWPSPRTRRCRRPSLGPAAQMIRERNQDSDSEPKLKAKAANCPPPNRATARATVRPVRQRYVGGGNLP